MKNIDFRFKILNMKKRRYMYIYITDSLLLYIRN